MLLEAKGVSKAFGSFFAVRNADLAVAEGEIIGLIGPNGAGKSTFFNCLTGDLPPTSGTVQFAGTDVTRLPPEARARLGLARSFQVPLTFESMSVLDNATIGALLRHHNARDARAKARDVLCTDPLVSGDPDLLPLDEVLVRADLLVIGAPHPQYRDLRTDKPVVDIWNLLRQGVIA